MATDSAAKWTSPMAYDRTKFANAFAQAFGSSPQYNAGSLPSTFALLGMIEKDRKITDLRWTAYMLATTMWETTSPTSVPRPAKNRKGVALKDKQGKPVMVKTVRWQMTMAPVTEVGHGKGRKYHEPAKIKLLADGSARITEHDGDQFTVKPGGKVVPMTKTAKMGAKDAAVASDVYVKDDGVEQVFYGRGYVQLTWWSNYAKAGVALGRGLDLLLDPELVKTPQIAFALMSYGMRTGQIFANGHMLDDYISGDECDYDGARAIVNGSDHAKDIAGIAKKFEAVLLKSRNDAAVPPIDVKVIP